VVKMAIGLEFLINALFWFARVFVSSLICLFLGYLGIIGLDYITTKITEFKTIKKDPLAISLFVGGFLIFAGLVVFGCMDKPFFQSQAAMFGPYFNIEQFINVVLSFLASLLFGWLFYVVFAKLTPFGVDLDDVNKSPVAVGFFLFGYEVFLGLIMYASITIPL
jgi:hypothetical protein